MDARMTLTQEQIQKLSAMQIQSLQILSMSSEDLRSLLQKESEENPFLDYHPSASRGGAAEFLHFVVAPEADLVQKFIIEQLNPHNFTKPQWALLTYLARFVDSKGYLSIDKAALERLSLPNGMYEDTLAVLQGLNPPGICATSLAECLKIQLNRMGKLCPLAEAIIDRYLIELSKNQTAAISKALGVSKQQLAPVLRLIKSLDPAPLKGQFESPSAYVVPDIIIQLTDTGYEILLNDAWTASYSISDYYVSMMRQTNDPDIKSYFQQKYSRCTLLMHNIERRRQTLRALTDAIWKWQYGYILQHRSLRPMRLKDISQMTGLHVSTISRAIKDKYVQTPWQTLPFKDLFQSPLQKNGCTLSKDAIKRALKEWIDTENKQAPYSDAQLVLLLSQQFNTAISRRVVQKYRNMLHIPNSYERKA